LHHSLQVGLARNGVVPFWRSDPVRHAVSLAALFSLVVPASAVPLPKGGSARLGPLSVKYLLDDADGVVVLNVRQVLASPVYQKAFAKQLTWLLRDGKVAATLQDCGVDPLKDIDRICLVLGRSSQVEQGAGIGAFLLVTGRFDPAKLKAGAKKLAKATFDHGSAKIFELALNPSYAAVLDKSHVVLASRKEQVQAALDKAAGKKKTMLKNKALAEMLAKIKPEDSLSVIATGDTVVGGTYSSVKDGNGERVTSKVFTLAESAGIKALSVVATVQDEVHVKVTMTAMSVDKARKVEKLITDGLQGFGARIGKEFPDLVKALKAVKIFRNGETITLQGKGSGEAVRDLFVGMFTLRSSSRPPEDQPIKRGKP
jgi:hypothetical protein